MADHNESPGGTENSSSQEFINTTDAEGEFIDPELPPYSFDDPNARENNRRNWTSDENDFEQRGFDYDGTTDFEYEEKGAASSRLFDDFPKTYDDSDLYAGRRQEKVKTRQFSGHYFVKDYLRATAAKSARNHPAHRHPPRPHPARPYPAKAYQERPHPTKPYPSLPYPGKPRQAQPGHSDRAQVHRYLEASPAPYQDQVFSLTSAERLDPAEPPVRIVYVALEQPKRPEKVSSYLGFSVTVALCFCLPLGLLTIYLSRKAESLWLRGNYRKAKSYSRAALILNIIGVILGVVLSVYLVVTKYSSWSRDDNLDHD
ncbi:unnamed protein product [Lymnaea stagnalis]|uniref:Uncharacterized protein n=1 Tax=Lymnaea stagnalis TaxID=6523 RepID=A0AAV2H6P1_LYMST